MGDRMRSSKRLQKWLFVTVIIALVFATLACGSGTTAPAQSTASNKAGIIDPTQPLENTETPKATKTLVPTNTPAPTIAPQGLSRSNPFPKSEIVATQNWEVQVIDVFRGAEAWKVIQAANMFNEEAPDGMEYLLIKLHVKNLSTDNEEHDIGNCDFFVTGDRYTRYTCSMVMVVAPEPKLDAKLYSGGETEGWVVFPVAIGERNLMLAVDELFSFSDDQNRYIALEDGAKLFVDPELSTILPSNIGIDRKNPASIDETITTEDWEFYIVDTLVGDEALAKIQEANQFNDPPEDGMQYILVKVHVRNIGTEDTYTNIDAGSFNITGSKGVLYDLPFTVPPDPNLNIYLFPSGEYEGWIVLQSAKDEKGLILVFDPLFDFSNKNQRFVSLEK